MSVESRSVGRATDASTAVAAPTTSKRQFVHHYLEMVAVMIVSMPVLGALISGILALFGQSNLRDAAPGLRALVMTINMVVGMTVWMRIRRHGWPSTLEMDVAMILPFVLLIGPYLAGLVSRGVLLGGDMLMMLPLMFLVMLRRYDEYAHAHPRHPTGHVRSEHHGAVP
jgi:hypothetical protein